MDKSIYSEMSNLRPKGRRKGNRQKDPGRPSDPTQSVDAPAAREPARTAPTPEELPAQPSIPRRTVITDPPAEVAVLPVDGHLAASLEHLRRRSTLRGAATEASQPAPAPRPEKDSGSGRRDLPKPAPEPLRRRERKMARRHARRELRQDARLAKEERAPAVRKKATGSRGGRRGRRGQPEQVPEMGGSAASPGPAPPPEGAPPLPPADRRQQRRAARQRIAEAKQAVAEQRSSGKARLAEATRQSRASDYLATKIEPGDWSRKELRRKLKAAKEDARAEVAVVKAQEAARLAAAKEHLLSEKQRRRRGARFGAADLGEARTRSIRLGLTGSWFALGVFTWMNWDAGQLTTDDYWLPLASGAAGLLVLSLVPWKRFGGRAIESVLVFLWLGLLMGVILATAPFHQSTLGIFVASVWIIVYAGVLLPLLAYALSSTLALATFGISVAIGPVATSNIELAWYVAGLAMTTVIVGITVLELRLQGVRTAQRLAALDLQSDALRRRESQLLQLYEVSRTIGAGEDMHQVLPELVARTAGYIGAKVGLVILHRPEENELVALSPLWVAGQALEAEGYRFEVDGDSTAASVFVSGAVYVRNEVTEVDISRDQLLADLGVERVAAVPLQVEGQTIGVLLVADKDTDFTEADTAALELLATPAGLVLNHLARYEQAQETGRRMSELAQLKSDFVSVVSHELRTPLTSVIGALSTLARPELAPDNPVAASLLDSASNQAKRLKTLIEDLLTVSKIDNEALPIRLQTCDIAEILTRLVERVPAWTDHVELALSPLLPKVALDPDHFERVITNLLDNARKYASDSDIEVTARAVDDEVWLSVIDHGEGIPYEYEDTIFERFTQIERPDTRFKGGTGLGLNIVKDLTEAMHGRVWLEATPGGGATFTVAFPRAQAETGPSLEVGRGMLLVDPSRDRVEAPINMDDLPGGGEGPVAE